MIFADAQKKLEWLYNHAKDLIPHQPPYVLFHTIIVRVVKKMISEAYLLEQQNDVHGITKIMREANVLWQKST